MHVYVCSWKIVSLPDDWTGAVKVPLHKGKDDKDECKNDTGIIILSIPGKVC